MRWKEREVGVKKGGGGVGGRWVHGVDGDWGKT